MKLKSKYQEIWDLSEPLLVKCRWWDLLHTEMSTDFMYLILKGEGKQGLEDILIPTIILHDVGWSVVGDEKNRSWGDKDMRVRHMEEGAKIAYKILKKIDYNPKSIPKITELVFTHDNFYLGKQQTAIEEKLVRDADACFVLTELSFWKDYYVNVIEKGEDVSPKDYLDMKIKKNSKRYTKTAKNITEKQIVQRKKEAEDKSVSPKERYKKLRTLADKRQKQ